jgi:hypothetical protein
LPSHLIEHFLEEFFRHAMAMHMTCNENS